MGDDTIAGWQRWWLRMTTVALLALVLVQCVVSISPEIYFDVDPAEAGEWIATGLGPAGAGCINLLSVLVAAAAIYAHVAAGGRLRWGGCLLAFVGMIGAARLMPLHAENLFRCGGWIGSVSLGIAAVHLAEWKECRRWMAAALVAMAAPLAIRALQDYFFTLPATLEGLKKTDVSFLKAKQWHKDSAEYLQLLRRLQDRLATGEFAISNVLGSVAGAMTVLATAIGIGAWRVRRWVGGWVPWAVAGAGAVILALTRSRGAGAVTAVVVLLLVLVAWRTRKGTIGPRFGRKLAAVGLVLVALAVGLVLVRGWIGPGEPPKLPALLSVLFRSQYWTGTAKMVAGEPWQVVVGGVGPGEFQNLYSYYKLPNAPETVMSAHNVLIDLGVMLGVGGLAWGLLLLMWLWQGGRGAAALLDTETAATPVSAGEAKKWLELPGDSTVCAVALAVVVFGVQYYFQRIILFEPTSLLPWVAGLMGFLGAMAVMMKEDFCPEPWVALGLFAAAVVLVVHNQIDMTFYQPGASTVAWVMVATAAGCAEREKKEAGGRRWLHWVLPAPAIAAAVVWMVLMQHRVMEEQAALAAGARHRRIGMNEAAASAFENGPESLRKNPTAQRWLALFMLDTAEAMRTHGDVEGWRKQMGRVSENLDAVLANDLPGELELMRLRADLHWQRGQMLADLAKVEEASKQPEMAPADRAAAAVETAAAEVGLREVIRRDPHTLGHRVKLADVLWAMDKKNEARQEYRSCLELIDRMYMDPLTVHLTKEDQKRVEERAK